MRASASPLLSRSPPRPSPGSLHYSDEDVAKYNDLIPAESSSLTEKPSEISDSQVRDGGGAPEMGGGAPPIQTRNWPRPFLHGPERARGPRNPPEVVQWPAPPPQALLRLGSLGEWGPPSRGLRTSSSLPTGSAAGEREGKGSKLNVAAELSESVSE